ANPRWKEIVAFHFLLCPIGNLYYNREFDSGNFKSFKDIQNLNLTATGTKSPNPRIDGEDVLCGQPWYDDFVKIQVNQWSQRQWKEYHCQSFGRMHQDCWDFSDRQRPLKQGVGPG